MNASESFHLSLLPEDSSLVLPLVFKHGTIHAFGQLTDSLGELGEGSLWSSEAERRFFFWCFWWCKKQRKTKFLWSLMSSTLRSLETFKYKKMSLLNCLHSQTKSVIWNTANVIAVYKTTTFTVACSLPTRKLILAGATWAATRMELHPPTGRKTARQCKNWKKKTWKNKLVQNFKNTNENAGHRTDFKLRKLVNKSI